VASLLSPDSKWLAVNFRRFIPPGFYNVVQLFEIESGREIMLQTNVYNDWRFSADSKMLAISASTDVGKITQRAVAEFWDVDNSTRKQVIEVPSGWQGAFTLAISPDGEIAAIGGRKMFGLFSIATGELLVEKAHPTKEFASPLLYDLAWIEFSPDGEFLLTGGNDGTVRLWRIKRK
jgi:WD40 repeat protein